MVLNYKSMRAFLITLIVTPMLSILIYASEKLVFKDGTIEDVEYYRIEGDKVVFKNPERDVEKVPRDKVDLKATEKLNKEACSASHESAGLASRSKERLPSPKSKGHDAQIHTKAEREAAGGKSAPGPPQNRIIGPGLNLPDKPGIYLYDGNFKLLTANTAQVDTDKGRKIIGVLGAPFLKQKKVFYLPEAKSAVRTKLKKPFLYVDPTERGSGKFVLLQLKSKGNRREVAEVEIDIKGQAEKRQETVPVSIRELGNGILEIFPALPLEPGEYGLAESAAQNPLEPATVKVEIVIWDFDVDKSEES